MHLVPRAHAEWSGSPSRPAAPAHVHHRERPKAWVFQIAHALRFRPEASGRLPPRRRGCRRRLSDELSIGLEASRKVADSEAPLRQEAVGVIAPLAGRAVDPDLPVAWELIRARAELREGDAQ